MKKVRSPGFTLIEMMVTVAVAAVLAAIGVPAFNAFVQNDRDANQINSLVISFNYARSEAIKRNSAQGVQVCASGGGTTCDSPASGWSAGWVVLDLSNPGSVPLQAVPALAGTNVLSSSWAVATGVTFKSSGSVITAGTVKICDSRGGAFARQVGVNAVGNIIASQTAGKDQNGAALACP